MSMVKRALLLLKMDVRDDMRAAIITATIKPRRPGRWCKGQMFNTTTKFGKERKKKRKATCSVKPPQSRQMTHLPLGMSSITNLG